MPPDVVPNERETDVVIIGAGLSGIGSAVRLQQVPGLTYRILEARSASGGTWDLFRYPGVRSDSDMFTLAYPFRPWRGADSIADGPDILTYLRDTADAYGVSEHIDYDVKVTHASWSTPEQRWTLTVQGADGTEQTVRTRFVHVCTGYYDADQAHDVEWPGRDSFAGQVIHPQFWPEDAAVDGARVVIIGSGATAVTLVPALAERAADVIMLQRSPSYVVSVPRRNRRADRLRGSLPAGLAHHLVRAGNIVTLASLYALSRRNPAAAKRLVLGRLGALMPPSMITDHFTPRYDVWDQRLCATPDGDLFTALRQGRARVITAEIDWWEPTGIRLVGGDLLEADVIITATGLQMLPLGGLQLSVDGEPVDLADTFAYRGALLAGVPNLAATLGYVNSSWTLRADLVSRYVSRLITHLRRHDLGVAVPVAPAGLGPQEWMTLTSGYVQRGIARFPKVGDRDPWRLRQSYPRELIDFRRARIDEDMQFLPHDAVTDRLPATARPSDHRPGADRPAQTPSEARK